MVKRSFKKCCISNALDSTEDDILWQESSESASEADSDGEDIFDDNLTREEVEELFGESEDESDFDE